MSAAARFVSTDPGEQVSNDWRALGDKKIAGDWPHQLGLPQFEFAGEAAFRMV